MNGSKLTKSEEAELRDAQARLERPWLGYTDSTVRSLEQIIVRLCGGNSDITATSE